MITDREIIMAIVDKIIKGATDHYKEKMSPNKMFPNPYPRTIKSRTINAE